MMLVPVSNNKIKYTTSLGIDQVCGLQLASGKILAYILSSQEVLLPELITMRKYSIRNGYRYVSKKDGFLFC